MLRLPRNGATEKLLSQLDEGTRSLVNKELFGTGVSRFHQHLWQTIECADKDNLQLLSKSFPEYVKAWDNYKYTPGWWDKMRNKFITASEFHVVCQQ